MDESSQSKLTHRFADRKNENGREEKMGLFPEKGIDFLRESETNGIGNGTRFRNPSSQELTLSYLCDNNNGSAEKELGYNKGKEVLVENSASHGDEKWIERDFLNLNNSSSKREIDRDGEEESDREKRPKLSEALSLSLALPEVSLSLTASNALQTTTTTNNNNNLGDIKPSRSLQSLTYNSNDYTAASLSHSCSHPLSHNPSCSLTRNSTENFDDQRWNCGEGTNGSVHSRFKPVGEGLVGLFPLMQGSNNTTTSTSIKDTENSLSFYPSELPARPVRIDSTSQSGSERKRASKPERLLREVVSESVAAMAQTIQELSEETIAFTKEHLRSLISGKKEELSNLQFRLERRSDLTKESLSKCQKDQLEILVAVKTGLLSFLATKNRLPATELVEIFLLQRCRNVNCKSALPVDDCDCKVCSGNGGGFCNSCMCTVCHSFDCANNTCSWVGCDVCSHWCHAACAVHRGLIRPAPSEMQFHCLGCGHASEMFGFVKQVFLCCAKDWGPDTLLKELDCVSNIFKNSQDFKGKELHNKAAEMILHLRTKSMTPKDAVKVIAQFFSYADSLSEYPPGLSSKGLVTTSQANQWKDSAQTAPQPISLPSKYVLSSTLQPRDMLPSNLRPSDLKPSPVAISGEDFRFGQKPSNDSFENLEGIVRIKEAEMRMFQTKADEALREAEEYHRMIRATTEKLEADYAERLNKLRIQETEDRRRKKLDELKMLENSHCDYYNMKMRMQGEISGLLERMEATKKQWV